MSLPRCIDHNKFINESSYHYNYNIHINTNLYFEELLEIKSEMINSNKTINVTNDIFENKNFFFNKFINYFIKNGNKRTAHNMYKDTFILFYSFFYRYNEDLNNTYPLYNTYYEYSISKKDIFFNPLFFFKILSKILEPTFIIGIKPQVFKKKIKKDKEIVITYIPPYKRSSIYLRTLVAFTKSFKYDKFYKNLTFSLLNTFLNMKNSFLYKQKILTYTRLLKSKKNI